MTQHVSRLARAAATVAIVAAGWSASPAQSQGGSRVPLPERTDAGTFVGTWYWVSRDASVALWIRETRRKPELKLRYLNTGHAESFETDWNGRAEYVFAGKLGKFSLESTERDANTIRGRWHWLLGPEDRGRTETARVTLYRADDGRSLVMNFEDLERSIGGASGTRLRYEQVWVLRKATDRLAPWDELPF